MTISEKYPVLQKVDEWLACIFAQSDARPWYADVKLWIGLSLWSAVWLKWLAKGYTANYRWKYAYTAGIDLAMLHAIQYYQQRGLAFAMAVLILQCGGTTYLWWKRIDVVSDGGFDATSVYKDISLPIFQVFTVFLGQLCLIAFYLSAIFNEVHKPISYVFWLSSFFCLQMAAFFNRGADSLLGTTWATAEWASIVNHASDAIFMTADHRGKTQTLNPSRFDLVLRGLFGFTVNNVFRDVLAFTVPILLAQFTDPLNFVVYCVGVNFIVTIDDMSAKRFEVRLRVEDTPAEGQPGEYRTLKRDAFEL